MNQTANSAKATKTIHGFPAYLGELGELGGSNYWAFLIQPGGKPAIITKARE